MKWLIISCLSLGAALFTLEFITNFFENCKNREDIVFKGFVYSFLILVGLAVFALAIINTVLL